MSFVELINRTEPVVGVVLGGEWLRVGHESYTVGLVYTIEVGSHVVRGATEPMVTVRGSTGTLVPNWEHVVAVIFAPPGRTPEPAPIPGDEDVRG